MYHLSINAEKLLEYLGNNDNGHEIIDSKVGRQILKFKKKKTSQVFASVI